MQAYKQNLEVNSSDTSHVFDANLQDGCDIQHFFQNNSLSNQTRFFRNSELFDGLADIVLHELVDKKTPKSNSLRIWSAGCSDGREPYSMAMVLQEKIQKKIIGNITVTLIASDINNARIETARNAIYSLTAEEIRSLNPYSDYIRKIGSQDDWQIDPLIQKMIHFKTEDIFRHTSALPYDFIVCTNVLLYYEKEFRKKLIQSILKHLRTGGLLYMESLGSRYLTSVGLKRVGPHFYYYQEPNDKTS